MGPVGASAVAVHHDDGVTAAGHPIVTAPDVACVRSAGDDVAALLGITAAGAITSLMFAARAAVTFMPKSDPSDTPTAPTAADATTAAAATAADAANRRNAGLAVATLAALAPLALTKHDPAAYGELMAIPAGLAWSVLGWLAAKDWKASGVPGAFLLNPMVAGALSANLGMLWHGRLAGVDYVTAMHAYLGQVCYQSVSTLVSNTALRYKHMVVIWLVSTGSSCGASGITPLQADLWWHQITHPSR